MLKVVEYPIKGVYKNWGKMVLIFFLINFFYFVDEIDVGYFFGVLGGNIADKIIDNIKI